VHLIGFHYKDSMEFGANSCSIVSLDIIHSLTYVYIYTRCLRNFRFCIGRDKMGFTLLVCGYDAGEPAFKYPCVSHIHQTPGNV
jgi:hypothetical protein